MKKILLVIIFLLLCFGLVGCDTEDTAQQVDQKIINRWSRRVDVPDKEWYVYVHAPISGEIIGYYVSSTIPLSYGVGLTNPRQIIDWDDDEYVLPAPGIDAVFYGGVDQSAWYFFDAETDALITTNMNITFMDQPLDIKVPKLTIKLAE